MPSFGSVSEFAVSEFEAPVTTTTPRSKGAACIGKLRIVPTLLGNMTIQPAIVVKPRVRPALACNITVKGICDGSC